MADLRRLGKRGAYRLGKLGAPPPEIGGPPPPHYPSFTMRHRGPTSLWLLAWLAAAAVIAAATIPGWWFVPFIAGLTAGIASGPGRWRLRAAVPATAAMAALGWAIPLGWSAGRGAAVRATARVVAALAGLPAHATTTIVLTLLVAVIQALAGLWLGRALFPAPRRS
jgi:hypothetical protein